MSTPSAYQRIGGESQIGPYSSRGECQTVNANAFAGAGSCECTEIPEIAEPSESYSVSSDASLQNQQEIEQKAKRDAEAELRRAEWEQKKTELVTSLKGSGWGDLEMKGGGEGALKIKDTKPLMPKNAEAVSGEDLLAELEAVQKEMKQTDEEVSRLTR